MCLGGGPSCNNSIADGCSKGQWIPGNGAGQGKLATGGCWPLNPSHAFAPEFYLPTGMTWRGQNLNTYTLGQAIKNNYGPMKQAGKSHILSLFQSISVS